MTAPQRRDEHLGATFRCECGREHSVPTREVLSRPGALEALPELAARHLPAGEWGIVMDARTREVAGARVETLLSAAGARLRPLVVPGEPVADVATVAAVRESARGLSALITVGSGTINDLGKAAASDLGQPFIAVATAASMNGYTSSIAALIDSGLKVTTPATPALAVLADHDVLAAAPAELTLAGLGDVVSKPVCNADWMLSHILRGSHYCPRPFALIKELEDVYLPRAAGLATGDRETVAALAEGLIYSGISMVIAGSSAPASGGEHLISHTIDMRALLEGGEHDYHGTQVGVATCFMARLYRWAVAREASEMADAPVDLGCLEAAITEDWGGAAPAVWAQTRAQYDDEGRPRTPAARIAERWDEIRERLEPFLESAARVEPALQAAGAATRPRDLGLDREGFRAMVLRAPFIRDRYTLLHLLRDTGLLEDGLEATLDEMGA